MTDEIYRLDFDEGTKPTVDRLRPQGYEPWETGGGCMAFGQNLESLPPKRGSSRREPGPPKRRGEYIMITNEAMTLPDWKDDQGLIMVGYYHDGRDCGEAIIAILPDLKSAVDMVKMVKEIRAEYPHVESWSDLDDNHCDANEFYPDFNDPISEEGKSQDHMDVMNIMATWCSHVMGDTDPVFDGEIIGKGGLIGEWSGCNNADPDGRDKIDPNVIYHCNDELVTKGENDE